MDIENGMVEDEFNTNKSGRLYCQHCQEPIHQEEWYNKVFRYNVHEDCFEDFIEENTTNELNN